MLKNWASTTRFLKNDDVIYIYLNIHVPFVFLHYKCFWSVITQFCFKRFHLCNHPLNITLIPDKRHPVSQQLGSPNNNKLEKTCCIKAPDLGFVENFSYHLLGQKACNRFLCLRKCHTRLAGKDLKKWNSSGMVTSQFHVVTCSVLFRKYRKFWC